MSERSLSIIGDCRRTFYTIHALRDVREAHVHSRSQYAVPYSFFGPSLTDPLQGEECANVIEKDQFEAERQKNVAYGA